jgi:hypothetical protein
LGLEPRVVTLGSSADPEAIADGSPPLLPPPPAPLPPLPAPLLPSPLPACAWASASVGRQHRAVKKRAPAGGAGRTAYLHVVQPLLSCCCHLLDDCQCRDAAPARWLVVVVVRVPLHPLPWPLLAGLEHVGLEGPDACLGSLFGPRRGFAERRHAGMLSAHFWHACCASWALFRFWPTWQVGVEGPLTNRFPPATPGALFPSLFPPRAYAGAHPASEPPPAVCLAPFHRFRGAMAAIGSLARQSPAAASRGPSSSIQPQQGLHYRFFRCDGSLAR